MRHLLKTLLPSVAVALTVTGFSLPVPARAQTYPIDCAILLCLAGGWPASVPCARARAEFIRRVTPWPVEPPLQIWRCPMSVSYERVPNSIDRVFDAFYGSEDDPSQQSFPADGFGIATQSKRSQWRFRKLISAKPTLADYRGLSIQDRADIDISGPEFNFVRSIRVFDVRYVRQKESDNSGDCNRSEIVVLGIYGSQGDFAWQRSSTAALPAAHSGLARYGEHCPEINHRSVFVEWRDYEGRYGFEQVNY